MLILVEGWSWEKRGYDDDTKVIFLELDLGEIKWTFHVQIERQPQK